MRYLVTGAAGFIGSKVSQDLLKAGNEVFCLDSLSDYYSPELKQMRFEALVTSELIVNNMKDRVELNQLIKKIKPDSVIHLGAQAGVRLSFAENSRYVESNLIAFSNILTSTIENNIPNFLYASSSSVYGDVAKLPYAESEKELYPNSFYGGTKLANEILAHSIIPNSRTKARGLRFFTVYGPWGRPDMVYFRIIANCVAGKNLHINGDGKIERDFTFIDDASKSVLLLAEDLDKRQIGFNDVVNVGGGSPCSILQLITLCESLSGKKVNYVSRPRDNGDVNKTMADPNYLKNLINFLPETKIDFGISETLNWSKLPEIEGKLGIWIDSVI